MRPPPTRRVCSRRSRPRVPRLTLSCSSRSKECDLNKLSITCAPKADVRRRLPGIWTLEAAAINHEQRRQSDTDANEDFRVRTLEALDKLVLAPAGKALPAAKSVTPANIARRRPPSPHEARKNHMEPIVHKKTKRLSNDDHPFDPSTKPQRTPVSGAFFGLIPCPVCLSVAIFSGLLPIQDQNDPVCLLQSNCN